MIWYNIFRKGAKGTVDKQSGPVRWEVDFPAVEFLFDAYGVSNKKEGLDVLYEIIGLYDNPDLSDEQILNPEED